MSSALEVTAGIVGPALIAYLVYRYRSIITYQLISLNESFRMANGHPVAEGWPRHKLTLEELELRNRGWRNLQRVRLHLEHTPPLFAHEVSSTKTIAKRSVKLEADGEDLLIEIDEFPRGEEITIDFSYFGDAGWGKYRDLKGASGTYKVARKRDWEGNRRAALFGALVGGLYIAIQIAIAVAKK